MTKLELINKSYVGIISHISSDTKLGVLEQYITQIKKYLITLKVLL
jgi:hypothetical protein